MDQNSFKTGQTVSDSHNDYEDEISLFDILSIIWKRKIFIIVSVFLCTSIAGAYLFFFNISTFSTSTLFSLNFAGIEKHNNPDGSTFKKNQIISPSILSKVEPLSTRKMISAENHSGYILSIDGIVPPEIAEKLKKKPDETYLPTLFSLTIKSKEANIISKEERSEILLSIIEEYKKEFANKYINESYFSEEFPDNFFQANDYNEIIDVLTQRINTVLKALDLKKSMAGYHSSTKKISFADLKVSLQILKTVDLKRITNVVENLNITKDKHLLGITLEQKIKDLEMTSNKETNRSLIAEDLLEKVVKYSTPDVKKGNTSADITIGSSFIEKLRKEDNLSYLIKTILESKSKANDLIFEKKKTLELLETLKQNKETSEKTSSFVDDSLKQLVNTYIAFVKDLNIINKESLSIKYANAIKVETPPVSIILKSKNTRVILCLAILASLFLSMMIAFFMEYIKNETSKQQVPQDSLEANMMNNFNQKIEAMERTTEPTLKKKRNAG